jgi:hypothetical protein
MNNNIVLGHLPTEDFEKFYNQGRLGKIFFPNGAREDIFADRSEERTKSYFTYLGDLYETLSEFKINNQDILSRGLIGIVATGKSVKYPGYNIVPVEHRKGLKFENWRVKRNYITIEEKIPIQPIKAEFFVITEDNPIPEECVGKTSRIALCRYTDNKHIGLTVRGIEQVVNGIKEGMYRDNCCVDKESIDAFQNGVPIIFDHQLKYIIEMSGVENYSPFISEWHFDRESVWAKIREEKECVKEHNLRMPELDLYDAFRMKGFNITGNQ